jgi:hypothetical protein
MLRRFISEKQQRNRFERFQRLFVSCCPVGNYGDDIARNRDRSVGRCPIIRSVRITARLAT